MADSASWRAAPTIVGLAFIGFSIASLYGLVISNPKVLTGVQSPALLPRVLIPGSIEKGPIALARKWLLHEPWFPKPGEGLPEHLDRLDYQLAKVRTGGREVPRIFLASLPADLSKLKTPGASKRRFIQAILPLILRVNQTIDAERRRLLEIRDWKTEGLPLGLSDQAWLEDLASRYEALPDDIDELMARVDIVPPSLALSQAAVESGWGRSRFAHEGNALFGQRVFAEGHGLLPRERGENEIHEVRAFHTLLDSVAAYVHNLNTFGAYRKFRAQRAAMREAGQALEGKALAEGLKLYAEERDRYIETVKEVMRGNRLWQFDGARLSGVELAGVGR